MHFALLIHFLARNVADRQRKERRLCVRKVLIGKKKAARQQRIAICPRFFCQAKRIVVRRPLFACNISYCVRARLRCNSRPPPAVRRAAPRAAPISIYLRLAFVVQLLAAVEDTSVGALGKRAHLCRWLLKRKQKERKQASTQDDKQERNKKERTWPGVSWRKATELLSVAAASSISTRFLSGMFSYCAPIAG